MVTIGSLVRLGVSLAFSIFQIKVQKEIRNFDIKTKFRKKYNICLPKIRKSQIILKI